MIQHTFHAGTSLMRDAILYLAYLNVLNLCYYVAQILALHKLIPKDAPTIHSCQKPRRSNKQILSALTCIHDQLVVNAENIFLL